MQTLNLPVPLDALLTLSLSVPLVYAYTFVPMQLTLSPIARTI